MLLLLPSLAYACVYAYAASEKQLSCALIEFEPAQIFRDKCREFSPTWPG